jgi:hypothetical protein
MPGTVPGRAADGDGTDNRTLFSAKITRKAQMECFMQYNSNSYSETVPVTVLLPAEAG